MGEMLGEVLSAGAGAAVGTTVGTAVGAGVGTGDVMMWNEAYDLSGQVNRIHLKNINGIQIDSPHFPPTMQEILDQQVTQTFLREKGVGCYSS